ncbi:hypothetical protein ACKU5V_027435 [Klebsiella pneumoniae]
MSRIKILPAVLNICPAKKSRMDVPALRGRRQIASVTVDEGGRALLFVLTVVFNGGPC